MIACPVGHLELEDVADDGREEGYDGHKAVADLALGEESEGVEAEEGTVGEACDVEEGVDERLVVEGAEGYDDKQVEQREAHMHEAADAEQLLLGARRLVEAEEVEAEGGGEGREGAVGT